MNHPTSKQPNPTKFHHNNRCLIPSFQKKTTIQNKQITQTIAVRSPGQIIKSNNDNTYKMQDNGALVNVENFN